MHHVGIAQQRIIIIYVTIDQTFSMHHADDEEKGPLIFLQAGFQGERALGAQRLSRAGLCPDHLTLNPEP